MTVMKESARRLACRVPRGILLVLFLAILLIFAISLFDVVSNVDDALFMAQWTEKLSIVNLLCDEVERYVSKDKDWNSYDYVEHMRNEAHALDAWPGLFAAVFDEDLNTLSERVAYPGEILLYPITDERIREMVRQHDSGEFALKYQGTNSYGQRIRIFFRWVPAQAYEHKALFMIGMREEPLNSRPSDDLTRWCTLLILITGMLLITTGIMDAARPCGGRRNAGTRLAGAGNPGVNGCVRRTCSHLSDEGTQTLERDAR